jgi:hypothetical protein
VLDLERGGRREHDGALAVARGQRGGLIVLGNRLLRWLDPAGQETARVALPRWPDLPVDPRCRLAADPAGTQVLVAVEAQTWVVRLVADGVAVATRDSATHAFAWWPDGRRCALAQGGGGTLLACGAPRVDAPAALLSILAGAEEQQVRLDGVEPPAALAIAPDGSSIACAGPAQVARWLPAEGRVARSVTGAAVWVAWLDRERLVLHDGDRVAVHDAATLERLALFDPWRGEGCRGQLLAADVAGARLALGTSRDVRVCELR